MSVMHWHQTNRADPHAALLADRHYSRQAPGTRQFTPPGRVLVLVTAAYDAVWASSWPYATYVNRAIAPGAWTCTIFRNESPHLSSALIRDAVAATCWYWGEPPAEGMVTMVDKRKVRGKRHFGLCFRHAGFEEAGYTKGGLLVLQLLPSAMPAPQHPFGVQLTLAETAG